MGKSMRSKRIKRNRAERALKIAPIELARIQQQQQKLRESIQAQPQDEMVQDPVVAEVDGENDMEVEPKKSRDNTVRKFISSNQRKKQRKIERSKKRSTKTAKSSKKHKKIQPGQF